MTTKTYTIPSNNPNFVARDVYFIGNRVAGALYYRGSIYNDFRVRCSKTVFFVNIKKSTTSLSFKIPQEVLERNANNQVVR